MTSNSWSSNLSVPCALGISSCALRYALIASSSGSGCSVLKARNTAYIKNSLGSIFIRIAHLLRFLATSPGSGHVNDQSPTPVAHLLRFLATSPGSGHVNDQSPTPPRHITP